MLVNVDYFGLNAFYVKRDAAMNRLRELTAQEGWRPHYGRRKSWQEQFREFDYLEFEEI
jgi:hypothetical protein